MSQAQRDQIATAVNEQYQKWFSYLYGYDGFPYNNISVNVVGWAVKDKALLEGSTEGLDIYTDVDAEGIPQCAESCGRFFNQAGDYSGCAGGAERHYDQSLWLTDGMGGGAGGDWGQRIGSEYFLQALGSENIHILLHEMVSHPSFSETTLSTNHGHSRDTPLLWMTFTTGLPQAWTRSSCLPAQRRR